MVWANWMTVSMVSNRSAFQCCSKAPQHRSMGLYWARVWSIPYFPGSFNFFASPRRIELHGRMKERKPIQQICGSESCEQSIKECQELRPSLQSGQIVVLDHLSIHTGERVHQAIEARGSHLLPGGNDEDHQNRSNASKGRPITCQ